MTTPEPKTITLNPGDSHIVFHPDGAIDFTLYGEADGTMAMSAKLVLLALTTVMWNCVAEHAASCINGTHGQPDNDIFGDGAQSKGNLQ